MLVGVALPIKSANAAEDAVGSVCFDNSSNASYINLNNTNNAVGTGDYTFEMWAKFSNSNGLETLLNGHAAQNGSSTLNLYINGAIPGGNFHMAGEGVENKWGTIPANTWIHYAYVRTNSTAKVYINGIGSTNNSANQNASVANTNNYTSSNFRLGYPLTGNWPGGFTGCLAGVSLTKSALYSGNFSANLPYPSTRVMPANSVIFLKPTAQGFLNSGTGATPAITGSVTFNTDLPSAPITLASATVTGSAIYNQVLTAVPGTVSNAQSYTTSYQWRRAGTPITNATNSTYTLTASDIGTVISVTITVTSGGVSSSVTSDGTASVAKIAQVITFTSAAPTSATYGSTYRPAASGGASGNAVTFTIDSTATSICAISAGLVSMTGVGTCKVNANQTSSANYSAATQAQQSFTIAKASQATTFTASLITLNLGQSDTLTATVTPGATGTVSFKDASSNTLCTTGDLNSLGVASCSWTPTTAGVYAVTAHYSGDGIYNGTSSSSTTVQVRSVISFDTNSGVGTAPNQLTYLNSGINLPAGTGLSKSGYSFGGWSTSNNGVAVSTPYSSDISRTLYAVWNANTYTITYNKNGGSGTQTADSYVTGATATTLSATTTFTRTGYSFAGWAATSTSTTPVTTYSTAANVIFYAIWTHGTYTVTYAANGGAGTMADQTSNATANLRANAFTYADRTFTGWNTSADGTGTTYRNSVSYPFLASITLYAQWGNVISFTNQGATTGTPSSSSQSWTSGSINLPTLGTMVRTGYTFTGWNNGSGTTYPGGSSFTPTVGITFNPVWTANSYSVTFDKNQATSGNVPSSQSWTTDTNALTLSGNIGSPALAKSGYTFGGWGTSASSTTPVSTYSTAANKTFYAIWTPINYSITYALNGGTSNLPTQASKYIYNTFALAATPTKADFYFAGWSDGATTYGALATYSITANTPSAITLTAQWIPIYTVSYVLNGSSSSVTGEGSYTSGTVVTLTSAPTRTGYTFNNWLDSSGVTHAAGSSFTVLQNSVLQAQWTPVLYSVTYALNGASGTLPLQSSLAMNSPFVVTSTEPVRAGYIFTGWSDGTSVIPAGATYVIGTSSVTLTAQWSAIPYSVTYDLGGGQGTLPTQVDGAIGSTFTLPATSANPTWIARTFTGWSDGAAVYAAGSTYTFGASNVTLTAQFSLNGYTQVTYSLGSDGAGALPNPTSALEGNTITIASGTGVTRSNYAFAGWSDGTATYQPGDTYLVGPEAAPITFVPNWTSGYNVTYSTGSGFGIAPIDTVGRITGATFSVASATTLSRQGFTFTGWSDGTSVVQPGATYTVASANITLTAQWVQNSLAGIASSALTPLASFSIVNGVGPSGSFNFGSTTISYVIPVNALSPGTTVSIYGLTDTSSISGVLPSGKTVVSSTVISWLSTDGTVPDASSPIAMTITNSEIVPGTVVYAITGSSIVNLGTATTNGSITTNITSDPVIVLANPYVAPVVSPTPVVTPPSSSGGGGGGYVAPTPTVDPAVAAAAAAKALADAKAAEEKAIADAKALAEKRAAEEAELLAVIKALQDKSDADSLAAAKKLSDELAAEQLKAEEELKAAAALKLAEEQRIAAERAAAAKKITTVYSITSSFKLNTTYTKRLNTYAKKIATGSTVTCIGYAKSSKTLSYAKAKVVATKQAKALCSSMKKINPTLITKSIVYPASKAPVTTVNKKWIPVSYRIESPVN
jgi:uncharacterized repeat protein (TIGR02543 family)